MFALISANIPGTHPKINQNKQKLKFGINVITILFNIFKIKPIFVDLVI